jgi:hypothetical protein
MSVIPGKTPRERRRWLRKRSGKEHERMAQLTIDDTHVILRMTGLDRILALKGELSIPLTHISSVIPRPTEAHNWFHGLRIGTNVPGIVTAGTFFTGDGLVFYDMHDPDKTIQIDLLHETYRRVIVQVEESPEEAVAKIEAALRGASR